jgi:hypothetical protein
LEIDVFVSVMFLSPEPYNFPASQLPSLSASQLLAFMHPWEIDPEQPKVHQAFFQFEVQTLFESFKDS